MLHFSLGIPCKFFTVFVFHQVATFLAENYWNQPPPLHYYYNYCCCCFCCFTKTQCYADTQNTEANTLLHTTFWQVLVFVDGCLIVLQLTPKHVSKTVESQNDTIRSIFILVVNKMSIFADHKWLVYSALECWCKLTNITEDRRSGGGNY